MESETLTPEQLKDNLAQFIGTQQYHKFYSFNNIVCTDGVAYLAENAKAYWLIDLIVSWQIEKPVRGEHWQTWTLTRNKENKGAVAVCTDGNERQLARQEIEYTDFPLPEIKLFKIDNVILLPSEY